MRGQLRPIEYLAWALSVPSGARWDLTASGVPDSAGTDSSELGFTGSLSDLCRRDRRGAIEEAFLAAVAQRYRVAPECVVPTLGASQAISQVLVTLARPGDHVIVERPTFQPLYRVPEMLGLEVSRLERRFEEGWDVLPDRLARLLTPKTRAVILSNLHNPSGVALSSESLVAIGEMAARVGAHVLVDEVYLDFAFDSSGERHPWRPAAACIDNGVSWSSTTKCFGFAALRAGWVVAHDREVAQAMRAASHYFHVDAPLPTIALATEVLRRADELTARANEAIAGGRARFDAWLAGESRLRSVAPSAGQTALLRLPDLMQDVAFAEHLREHYDTQVVPGTMFEAPGTVRVSFNSPANVLDEALANVSAALDDLC